MAGPEKEGMSLKQRKRWSLVLLLVWLPLYLAFAWWLLAFVGGLLLDPISHRVTIDGKPADMGPTEYRLLHFFMTHPERVYTRSQLLDHVWGGNVYVEERTVDVHIKRLRAALKPAGCDAMIETVRGSGYRLAKSA